MLQRWFEAIDTVDMDSQTVLPFITGIIDLISYKREVMVFIWKQTCCVTMTTDTLIYMLCMCIGADIFEILGGGQEWLKSSIGNYVSY